MAEKRSWLTPKEVAYVLDYGERHVRWLCDRGRIPGAYRLDPAASWRIPKTYVAAALRLSGRSVAEIAEIADIAE